MPYVHFGNGEHRKVTTEELTANQAMSGSHNAFRDNGVEHHIVGVYPDEVEYEMSDEEKGAASEKAQYEEWKRSRALDDSIRSYE